MADDPGRRIVESAHVLEPIQVSLFIVAALFETGPTRLKSEEKRLAVNTITICLAAWKRQLDRYRANEVSDWKKRYEDAKAELDDVKLKFAILQKES